MKNGFLKTMAVLAVLGTLGAMAAPQSGPMGPRRPPGGGGGGGGGGGTGGGGGGGGRPQVDPPPSRRNDPPPSRRNDPPPGNPFPSGGGTRNDGGSRSDDGPRGTRGGSQGGGGGVTIIRGEGPRGSRPNISSRSGRVQYGTTNNYGTRTIRVGNVRIEQAPILIDNGVLSSRVNRSERIGIFRGGLRSGYYHYNPNWCDDWFVYPHYVFDPFAWNRNCYVSPWYYYASLPAYLNPTRVVVINNFPTANWYGQPYRYQRYDNRWDNGWGRNDRNDLDDALEDLTEAFERADRRTAGRLIPRGGHVNIYNDGRYGYSLSADDFYDLFMDGLHNNDTRRYEIVNVELSQRGDSARVAARHEIVDPWGNRQTIWHQIYLERERRDFVIREFGTSTDRGRW